MQTKPKTPEELNIMRENGKIHKKVFEEIKKIAIPGVNTKQIDDLVWNICNTYNIIPAFFGIDNFKGAICINVNDCVAHGEPSEKIVLQDGDVVTFDFGVKDKKLGLNTDAAFTMIVGKPSHSEVERFLKVNEGALMAGIKKAVPGNRITDIGSAIEDYVKESGFHIIKALRGHAIGYNVHEKPYISNFKIQEKGDLLVENMTLCIEPLLGFNTGEIMQDNSGIYLKDGSLGSQFEHTIIVKNPYPEIII